MPALFANRLDMQHRLFTELSAMFGQEVPLYDKSLLANLVCNRAVCALLAAKYPGFVMGDALIEKTSGERHGAIRIGKPDEYRWIGRFFAVFAMEPHNFYDMTALGAKSQPVISTAFRAVAHPEHRIFSSLLQTNYFDEQTRQRIEALLADRHVFSDRAKELIEKDERQGGLSPDDADALIREGTERIFKWTGQARDHQLYLDLCEGGFKIAADVACFNSHHLNHLTPNTFCMDLYTWAMKFGLGECDETTFRLRAHEALTRLLSTGDRDYMALHFKHLTHDQVHAFPQVEPDPEAVDQQVDALIARLQQPDLDLSPLDHAGFKDFTEGPAVDTPVLLRQDAYRALTEPVTFHNADGSTTDTVHTARFGEIEQRFYATTPKGRDLYDHCLSKHESARAQQPDLAKQDFPAYQARQIQAFAPLPKTLPELLDQGLVYGHYEPTAAGLAAAGTLTTTDLHELVRQGHIRAHGLRYEDFLPFSAAGIFASNLNQYGTASTAHEKPHYTQATLEAILGKPIIDTDTAYRSHQARSLLSTYEQLGLLDQRTRMPPRRHADTNDNCLMTLIRSLSKRS